MATVYGANGSAYWRTYLVYTVSSNTTQTTITYTYYLHLSKELHKDHTYTKDYDTTYVTCTGKTKKTFSPSGTLYRGNCDAGDNIKYGNGTFTVTRTTSAQTVTLSAYINHPKTYSGYIGTSTAKATITIPALAKYTTSFNSNGSGVTNMPSSVTHYHGKKFTVPTTTPKRAGYSFKQWNTKADGSGTKYTQGASYTSNANLTLYAIWTVTSPPTLDYDVTLDTGGTESKYVIRGYTDIKVDISNLTSPVGRTISSVQFFVEEIGSDVRTTNGQLKIEASALTDANLGENAMYLVAEDAQGATTTIQLGNVVVIDPSWQVEVEIEKGSTEFPRITQNGDVVIDTLYAKNYQTNQYDSISTTGLKFIDNGASWGFIGMFDADHVDLDNNNEVDVKVYYRHFTEEMSDARRAFFTTSRNQNYTNGIYNMMFVSGCDNTLYPEYNSRVWWSKVNDPLYFPDLNYSEVGSNDTSVQGLTKVGDYLGVVKQSKTTDTAIFLLYPTSFEEITTFAVRQGVQGVGALARYSFNVLGDETLFLSPQGVMAIVPAEDNEHKVQNRSYFVDKRMLAEDSIESAYSFVHDGKYYLALGDGKGSVYVLDGNQRNSWGNDKTNLVYECYYLENVPANCFVKFNDELVFSTANEVCKFGEDFHDAYDNLNGEQDAPVKAEWSTILDDDNALHYYKTMQKKGNLVSILPLDKQVYYTEIEIGEELFDKNKTLYFVYDESKEEYVPCTSDTVFDENETYYVRHRSSTKVLVKKDNKEAVEIGRTFNESSRIPSEMYLNKKFKKYKRLQIILKNEEDEDFGVDSIVKNYTIGNYAKK